MVVEDVLALRLEEEVTGWLHGERSRLKSCISEERDEISKSDIAGRLFIETED